MCCLGFTQVEKTTLKKVERRIGHVTTLQLPAGQLGSTPNVPFGRGRRTQVETLDLKPSPGTKPTPGHGLLASAHGLLTFMVMTHVWVLQHYL